MEYTWQYYDLLLAGIAVSMLVGAAVGLVSSVSFSTATTGAGVLAAVLIGIGLFVIGPVEDPKELADSVDTIN